MASTKHSTVPSPPSATGTVTTWHSGKNRGTDWRAMSQISKLDRVPLKESEMTMHFFMPELPYLLTTLMGSPAM